MAGALGSQYIGGLPPCEMCHWQRWPHYAAIVVAGLAFFVANPKAKVAMVALAALAIGISGAIGAFHAGVEYGWWQGLTQCAQPPSASGGDFMEQIMKAPLIRCDQAPWSLFGISLAGYNAILSLGGMMAICALLKPERA
jgi:disulfide bond formation protein DsbB